MTQKEINDSIEFINDYILKIGSTKVTDPSKMPISRSKTKSDIVDSVEDSNKTAILVIQLCQKLLTDIGTDKITIISDDEISIESGALIISETNFNNMTLASEIAMNDVRAKRIKDRELVAPAVAPTGAPDIVESRNWTNTIKKETATGHRDLK